MKAERTLRKRPVYVLTDGTDTTLWIDKETGLPLQRMWATGSHALIDRFFDWSLDQPLDPALFAKPK